MVKKNRTAKCSGRIGETMKISKDEVLHVAKLACLKFRDQDAEQFAKQLDEILRYMDKINELETCGVPPTFHALSRENVFRKDETKTSLNRKIALKNAPSDDGENFIVPKIF